ncbi:MAG TPA: hypothetical protein VLX90_10185 [Steroidobacteraceae bacterium]|nr:hypothetical protein [Steroidobacteraceae bacterium]
MAKHLRCGRARWAALFILLLTRLVPGAEAQDNPAVADSPAAKSTARPIRKDRIFVWDLQGTWISKRYLDALKATRSPHATARKTPVVVIKVQKEGQSYPILITNFEGAVLQFLLDVEPGLKSGHYRMVAAPEDGAISASEVTYIAFRGTRTAEGKLEQLSIAEPNFGKRRFLTFVHLPDTLDLMVDRLAIAGKYKDEQGRDYEFTDSGDAILPDRRFAYEVSLDPRSARCELLQSHRDREPNGTERIGFDWKGRTLRLFEVKASGKDRYQCDRRPFAVLTPA